MSGVLLPQSNSYQSQGSSVIIPPKYIPTLSEDGWMSDPLQKGDYLFAVFMLSEYSQTTIYPRQVSSFSYIMEEGTGDPAETARLLETQLTTYFTRHFNNVTVSADYPSGQQSSLVYLTLSLNYEDNNGKTYSLIKAIETLNSKVVKIENIVNGY